MATIQRPKYTLYLAFDLHFTQKVVGELPFLLHQNCLHIKEHFFRKFKKFCQEVLRYLNITKY